jgi:hypothetical protein
MNAPAELMADAFVCRDWLPPDALGRRFVSLRRLDHRRVHAGRRGRHGVSTLIGSRIITNALLEEARSRVAHGLEAALTDLRRGT